MSFTRSSAGAQMLAEIHEQPGTLRAVASTVPAALEAWESSLRRRLSRLSGAVLFGSGSSYHAALVARVHLERLGGVPARVEHASEVFRYPLPGAERTLALALSHSGGSSDVRAAVGRARAQGLLTIGITNIEDSPLTRSTDRAVPTGAGPERAIPSTKGFTALAAASLLFASFLAELRVRRKAAVRNAVRAVARASRAFERWLETETFVEGAADRLASAGAVVFLGGGILHPVALDGALKFLEVTYRPALAFPPEEFRHGPMALLEPGVGVVVLSASRSGTVPGVDQIRNSGATVITLGEEGAAFRVPASVRPLTYAPPLQLLAHAVGERLGRAIDAPRGLTKIVG